MNNTVAMGRVHDIIRKGIDRLEREGLNQTEIAHRCKLSQPTINKYLKYEPTPDRATLKKFSHGLDIPMEDLLVAEGLANYQHASAEPRAALPPTIAELVELAKQLDHDELSTLKRCAAAFTKSTPDVRQHLIGQLKIIERLVEHETSGGASPPTAHKKTGAS